MGCTIDKNRSISFRDEKDNKQVSGSENYKNWLKPHISEDRVLIFEQLLRFILVKETKKNKYTRIWKPYLEKASGYVDNGTLNYLYNNLGFISKENKEDKKICPYYNYNYKLNLVNLKLVWDYFGSNIPFNKLKKKILILELLPENWFKIIYSEYILFQSNGDETLKDYLKKLNTKQNEKVIC